MSEEEVLRKYSPAGLRKNEISNQNEINREEKMSDFDQIKALKEEIEGLIAVRTSIIKRFNQLSIQYGELEVELHSVTKLRGFADAELDRKRKVLQQLQDDQK